MSKYRLPPVAEALLQPQSYPHKTGSIQLMQTQMSFIFLTGDYVYKVKKAINLGYLDYTTLEKRHFFCRQELKLNRRLCSDTYLDIVAINNDRGIINIEGKGDTIEYAIKMRQLPQDRMMDILLLSGQVSKEMTGQVAKKLACFHQSAKTSPEVATFGELEVICQNNQENFRQAEKYIGISISQPQYMQIANYTANFINTHSDLFTSRIREDKIKDCHGDLHCAHVCFTNDICIYDCIEFNDRFRYSDVASEMAFLAMDLDRYQRSDLSRYLIDTYVELSGDAGLSGILNFYKCYRAYVRGKVESFKLDDPLIPLKEKEQILPVARRYFELAESYTY
jgi:aminoglycoside phosphotransferase family enzyme